MSWPIAAGWEEVEHKSGKRCYFHRESHVVTWQKPYVIDHDDVQNHELNENVMAEKTESGAERSILCQIVGSQPSTESQNQNETQAEAQSLTPLPMTIKQNTTLEGLKRVIGAIHKIPQAHIRKIVFKYNTSDEKYEITTLEDINKLNNGDLLEVYLKDSSLLVKDGKNHISLFNEYCSREFHVFPEYLEEIIANDKSFESTVLVKGRPYAFGISAKKKLAKLTAAENALKIFMPSLFESDEISFKELDVYPLNTPDICEFLKKSFALPSNILIEYAEKCLKTEVHSEIQNEEGGYHCSIRVLDILEKLGSCPSEEEAKETVSILVLRALFPLIENCGQLLRMVNLSLSEVDQPIIASPTVTPKKAPSKSTNDVTPEKTGADNLFSDEFGKLSITPIKPKEKEKEKTPSEIVKKSVQGRVNFELLARLKAEMRKLEAVSSS